jgi:hypothetical protein
MTKDQIDKIFDHARHWPLERQEKAAALLLALEEQGTEVYERTPEELAHIEGAEGQAEQGEFATDEEIKALFDRYRRQRGSAAPRGRGPTSMPFSATSLPKDPYPQQASSKISRN